MFCVRNLSCSDYTSEEEQNVKGLDSAVCPLVTKNALILEEILQSRRGKFPLFSTLPYRGLGRLFGIT